MLKDVEFREVQELVKVDKVKIVACDGKSASGLERLVVAVVGCQDVIADVQRCARRSAS